MTPEQIEQRRRGIGGSDAGAIAGVNPWRTPLDVYLEKTEGVQQEQNDAMLWGTLLEDIVAQEYQRRTGREIAVLEPAAHPKHRWMLATPDRQAIIDGIKGILEVKTARTRSDQWGEPGTDEVPFSYRLQVAHYLAVYGLPIAELAVLFLAEREFSVYRFERDSELEQDLIQIEGDFWEQHVLARVPPAPRSSSDVPKLFPKSDGSEVKATGNDLVLCAKLADVKAKIKALQIEEGLLVSDIQNAMGVGDRLIDPVEGHQIATWKNQTRTSIDTTALRRDYPEAAKACQKETSFRVFRLKEQMQ